VQGACGSAAAVCVKGLQRMLLLAQVAPPGAAAGDTVRLRHVCCQTSTLLSAACVHHPLHCDADCQCEIAHAAADGHLLLSCLSADAHNMLRHHRAPAAMTHGGSCYPASMKMQCSSAYAASVLVLVTQDITCTVRHAAAVPERCCCSLCAAAQGGCEVDEPAYLCRF
jgi:hypothetical protein